MAIEQDWFAQSSSVGGLALDMHLWIVCTLLISASGQTSAGSTGQTTIRSRWDGAATTPTSAFESPSVPERPLEHLVRRVEELPAPSEVLPAPGTAVAIPAIAGRSFAEVEQPFTIDYVLIGRAGLPDASTNVKMQQIGLDYRMTRPFFSTRAAFTFRPAAEILFLSGPGGPDIELPEQLYKIAFDFQLDIPINEVFGISLGITPGLWSDLIVIDGEDFRLPARALATWRVNETLFVAGGIIYTDNLRKNLLPGIGIIWNPNDHWHFEILYPRSRLVYKFNEKWDIYLVFERGGTTYNIRANGQNEDAEYRDLRIMLGTDITQWEKIDAFIEMGMAFDREFRIDVQGDFNINEAFILRTGIRF